MVMYVYGQVCKWLYVLPTNAEYVDKLSVHCCSKALSVHSSGTNWTVAPITGNDMGVKRAEIRQGVREVVLCKDMDGKIGLRLKAVDNVRCILKPCPHTTHPDACCKHCRSAYMLKYLNIFTS